MLPFEMTKTKETEDKYEYQTKLLYKRYRKDLNNYTKVNFPGFYSWFLTKTPTWQHATVRQYKSAILHTAKKYNFTELEILFDNIGYKNCKAKTSKLSHSERKTRAQGAKSISEKNINIIFESVKSLPKKSYWVKESVRIFSIILMFGLRRKECKNLEILNGFDKRGLRTKLLKVKNAKHTNLRAHGEYRHIALSKYNRTQIKFLEKFIVRINDPVNASGKKIPAKSYLNRCSKAFSEHTKNLFPKRKSRLNLYTGRHQFCANLKKMNVPIEEAAALMGHSVTDTHLRHYGKRRFGFVTPYLPIALESEAAKVKVKDHKSPYSKNSSETKPKKSNVFHSTMEFKK